MANYVPGSFNARAGILGDLAYVDDTETVTVFQPGSKTGFAVANVVREEFNVTYESVGNGEVPGTMIRFWFGFVECPSEPLRNAQIVDADGIKYRVGDHAKQVMRLAYSVDCAKEVG